MSQWRVLDLLNFSGEVTAGSGHVQIGDKSVALVDVSTILVGPNVKITGSLIDRACAFGVAIVPCDWRGVPLTTILGWSTHSFVGARHIAQAALSEPRRKNAWMQLMKAKIGGQAQNLEKDSAGYNRLNVLKNDVKSGDPTNCEAQAAKAYWAELFPNEGFYRDRNSKDNRNIMLNYGYTVLRGQVIRNIVAAGLWPTLGIWHRNRGNAFALADDLIEPFRPAVDWVVAGFEPETQLQDDGVRQKLVSACEQKFGGASYTVSTEIERAAQHFGQYVEGQLDRYSIANWQPPAERNG